jgi:PAS domain S-box-containing protein
VLDISPESTVAASPADTSKARILIVDDDERTQLAVSTVLADLGQTLVTAGSGEEALKHLLHDDFAVILLDLHMPGIDGYETAAMIRARKRTRHIPILFLTAVFRDTTHLLQAYSAGAVDMVFKPVDPIVLKSKVAVFVDLYLKQAEITRAADARHRLQEENFRVRTEKFKTEQALRRTEEDYRLLVNGVRDYAIYMLDPQGGIISWNAGASRIKQYSADEVVGKHFSHFYTDEDLQSGEPARALQTAAEHGKYEAEGWRVRKDGSRFWSSTVIEAIYDDAGALLGFAKITRDITDKKETQAALDQAREQLSQAQKMEAVGQLTGGIAHDFNNLLTIVLGNIDLLERRSTDERMQRQLGAMRHAAERGRSLTGQLLAFSRRQHLNPETLDVNMLLQRFVPLIQRAMGESIALRIGTSDVAAVCEVDAAQLETALLNLAVNARDAMPDGGTVEILVRVADHAPELLAQHPDAPPGPWVILSVQDAGVGMPKQVVSRAFEPFFTTKEPGKGSGLGLSQVYGFVIQSGGLVTLSSEIGQGTQISIYLPQSNKPVMEARAEQIDRDPVTTKAETVLVVEDDSGVLALTSEMLNELGYQVITASDAKSALEVLQREPKIDLVFTDVVMPGGQTGIQLATAARKMRPGIKILLTSGYTGEALARHQPAEFNLPLIPKPFRQADLGGRLRTILDGDSAA